MQATLAERPSSTTRNRFELSSIARELLERHPHFRGRLGDVKIEQQGRSLKLTGRLPTFYLKQLLQEALCQVPGVQNVFNHIDVVCATGVSSVRN